MSGKKLLDILKHFHYVSLIVPAGLLVASAIYPLQPIIRQAFIGIMLVWFGIEAMIKIDA
jgi:hypothetical protein